MDKQEPGPLTEMVTKALDATILQKNTKIRQDAIEIAKQACILAEYNNPTIPKDQPHNHYKRLAAKFAQRAFKAARPELKVPMRPANFANVFMTKLFTTAAGQSWKDLFEALSETDIPDSPNKKQRKQ